MKQLIFKFYFSPQASDRGLTSFKAFASARNDVALDVAVAAESPKKAAASTTTSVHSKCSKCKEDLPVGSLAVVAPRVGLDAAWHPSCFTCSTCDELLVRELKRKLVN